MKERLLVITVSLSYIWVMGKFIKNFQKHLIFCQKLGIIIKNIKERRRVGANPTL